MSNKRKARSRTRRRTVEPSAAPPAKAKVRSPSDALAMIPYLLGFEPDESLVLVSLHGPKRNFGPLMRADLVEPDEAAALVGYLVGVVEAHGFDQLLIVAFSRRRAAADAAVPLLIDALEASGVAVYEGLRADGGRWWSYTCDRRDCCPPEGTPYDPTTSALSALAVASGMPKATSRQALADQFEPRGDEVRRRVGELAAMVAAIAIVDDARPTPAEVAEAVGAAIDRPSNRPPDLAMLLGLVQDRAARDAAWELMTRDDADRHFELWRQVMTVAPDSLLAPAGSLCAFAAWLAGHGALAALAADRVCEVAPEYPMIALVRGALDLGLNPDEWDQYRRSRAFVS